MSRAFSKQMVLKVFFLFNKNKTIWPAFTWGETEFSGTFLNQHDMSLQCWLGLELVMCSVVNLSWERKEKDQI